MNDLMSAMQKIIYIAKTHHSVIETRMKDIDMHRSMHMMLSLIAGCETLPSQKDIAQKLNISAAAVAATLERLEADGYVEKIPLDSDRRSNSIKATPAGKAALKTTCEIFAKTDRETFDGLDGSQFGELCKYLDVIANNLTNIKGDCVAKGGLK